MIPPGSRRGVPNNPTAVKRVVQAGNNRYGITVLQVLRTRLVARRAAHRTNRLTLAIAALIELVDAPSDARGRTSRRDSNSDKARWTRRDRPSHTADASAVLLSGHQTTFVGVQWKSAFVLSYHTHLHTPPRHLQQPSGPPWRPSSAFGTDRDGGLGAAHCRSPGALSVHRLRHLQARRGAPLQLLERRTRCALRALRQSSARVVMMNKARRAVARERSVRDVAVAAPGVGESVRAAVLCGV
ncbi:hypothetical protein BJY52DRAFT_1187649 [Lactarius psammicola]|nr:hypothetical protein BJY52DRAFT_1187649 [Lactarius psammicola]